MSRDSTNLVSFKGAQRGARKRSEEVLGEAGGMLKPARLVSYGRGRKLLESSANGFIFF